MEAYDTKDKFNQICVVCKECLCSKIFHLTWYRHDTILQINNKVITDKNSPFSVYNAFILSLLKLCHHVMHVFSKGISERLGVATLSFL